MTLYCFSHDMDEISSPTFDKLQLPSIPRYGTGVRSLHLPAVQLPSPTSRWRLSLNTEFLPADRDNIVCTLIKKNLNFILFLRLAFILDTKIPR